MTSLKSRHISKTPWSLYTAQTPPMEDNNSTKYNPITSWTLKLYVAVNRSIDSIVRVTMQFFIVQQPELVKTLKLSKMDNAHWLCNDTEKFSPDSLTNTLTHMHTNAHTYPQNKLILIYITAKYVDCGSGESELRRTNSFLESAIY